MYEHINNHYYVVLMIIHIQMYINSMFVCVCVYVKRSTTSGRASAVQRLHFIEFNVN